jgi:hypothetical protein
MYAGSDPPDFNDAVQREIVRRSELPAMWALIIFCVLYSIGVGFTITLVSMNTTFTSPHLPPSAVPGYGSSTQTAMYGIYWWLVFATDAFVCIPAIVVPLLSIYAARKRQNAGFIRFAMWMLVIFAILEGAKLAWLAVMWGLCKSMPFCRGYADPTHPNPTFLAQMCIQLGRLVILICAAISANAASEQFATWLAEEAGMALRMPYIYDSNPSNLKPLPVPDPLPAPTARPISTAIVPRFEYAFDPTQVHPLRAGGLPVLQYVPQFESFKNR